MEPGSPVGAASTQELLQMHESRSQARYEHLLEKVNEMTDVSEKVNVHLTAPQDNSGMLAAAMMSNRSDPAALMAAMGNNRGADAGLLAAMAAGGGGFGGNNGLWPLLLLGLLGRNGGGLWGGNDGGAGVSGLNNVQGAIDTSAILQQLADIKAQVPLSACETMAAITAAANDINTQTLNQTLALSQQANANQLSNVQNFANTGDKIDALSTAVAVGFGNVNTNIERTGWQVSNIVKEDGEKTRALITANQIAELNRIAAERQDEIIELRYDQRRQADRHGIEISMTNNQNQNQLQFQAQAQVLNNLSHGLIDALQSIRATNQAINIGAGTQTANPVNTNTNVRA